jgi:DNA-3-methyladenine glycosylase I
MQASVAEHDSSALPRCPWAGGSELELSYHDHEWGRPNHDDRHLFEMLVLEGAQAGLSWRLILARREQYRQAFHGFEMSRVAAMTDEELEGLVLSSGIIRNRTKIRSARTNARLALDVVKEHGSLGCYLWSFVEGKPIINRWKRREDVPARTELSDRMSKALQKRGFGFVGSTICYALMQATGMVNDHLITCFCHPDYRRP